MQEHNTFLGYFFVRAILSRQFFNLCWFDENQKIGFAGHAVHSGDSAPLVVVTGGIGGVGGVSGHVGRLVFRLYGISGPTGGYFGAVHLGAIPDEEESNRNEYADRDGNK